MPAEHVDDVIVLEELEQPLKLAGGCALIVGFQDVGLPEAYRR